MNFNKTTQKKDECTSAVSVDVEERLYHHAREMGITCVTISQRLALQVCKWTELGGIFGFGLFLFFSFFFIIIILGISYSRIETWRINRQQMESPFHA